MSDDERKLKRSHYIKFTLSWLSIIFVVLIVIAGIIFTITYESPPVDPNSCRSGLEVEGCPDTDDPRDSLEESPYDDGYMGL